MRVWSSGFRLDFRIDLFCFLQNFEVFSSRTQTRDPDPDPDPRSQPRLVGRGGLVLASPPWASSALLLRARPLARAPTHANACASCLQMAEYVDDVCVTADSCRHVLIQVAAVGEPLHEQPECRLKRLAARVPKPHDEMLGGSEQ